MKRMNLLVLSALVAGLQVSIAQAEFPADGEGPFDLPAIEAYADRMARLGDTTAVAHAEYPADGEGPFGLAAIEPYAERMAREGNTSGAEVWGVSPREGGAHSVFPFSDRPIDD